jgi:low affinity Fe/Cu permease
MIYEQVDDAKYLRYDYLMLQDALDWVGIDYLLRQTDDKEQTQVTINSTDARRLAQLIQVGSKHE